MVKRLLFFLFVVIVLAAMGTYAYSRYRIDRRLNGGEVVADDSGKVIGDDGSAPVLTPSRSDTTVPQADQTRKPSAAAGFGSAAGFGAPVPSNAAPAGSPTGDSMPANAPNRQAFGGSGHFQVYRQGDLTWRFDTETGSTCVLFATMDEWRRADVYRRACSND